MHATAAGCELDVERGPDWLLVRVRSLDDDCLDSLPLSDELWALLERHSIHRMVLELDRVPALSRHLIDELDRLEDRIREHQGILRLCGLSSRNHRMLEANGIAERLHVYPNRDEAVMGHPVPRRPR